MSLKRQLRQLGVCLSLLGLGVLAGADRAAQAHSPPPGIAIDPDLWREPRFEGLARRSDLGLIQVSKASSKELFNTQRAVLRVPGTFSDAKLRSLMNKEAMTLPSGRLMPARTLAHPPGRQPTTTRPRTGVIAGRAPIVIPEQFIYVSLKGLLASEATLQVNKAFGGTARFDSAQSLQAMGRILQERARLTPLGVQVLPDFQTFPVGIVTPDSILEDSGVTPQPSADAYWSTRDGHDLWRAWQLAQVANPAVVKDVWVGLVDQGFGRAPAGLVWDKAHPNLAALDVPNDQPRVAWHGAMVGSALAATVGDHLGAAGSALLGSGTDLDLLVERRIRTIAVQMAPLKHGWKELADGIDQAVVLGATVVSVSYAGNCDAACTSTQAAEPLKQAIARANKRGVIVLFAAGNDNLDLDKPTNDYVGCETLDALCIGGIDRNQLRWWGGNAASNYGTATALFGPAEYLWLNPNNGSSGPMRGNGTSLATPFVAGMLALAQSSWGRAYSLADLRKDLNEPGVLSPTKDGTINNRRLNAYRLMRLRAQVARDRREPNESPAAGKGWSPLADDGELLSLHAVGDHDWLRVDSSDCEHLHARIDYLQDEPRHLAAEWHPESVSTRAPAAEGDSVLSLEASVCPGVHSLHVYSPDGLTTGYSVRLRRTPITCDKSCAGADGPSPPDDVPAKEPVPRGEPGPGAKDGSADEKKGGGERKAKGSGSSIDSPSE